MIYVVGIGPGNPKYLTNIAEDIIFKSDYVLSYKRVKETCLLYTSPSPRDD